MKKKVVQKLLAAGLSAAMMISSFSVGVLGAGLPFTDVKEKDWFYKFVQNTYDSGVLKGTSGDKFSPYVNMTRGMFVQALSNNASNFKKVNKPDKFTDVPSTAWYYDAVQWASELKLISGTGSGKFSPDASISREDMCVIIQNYVMGCTPYFDYPKEINEKVFKDFSSISDYAVDAVNWASSNKIVEGMEDGKFYPAGILNRAEAATVLSKLDKVKDPVYETKTMEIGIKDGETILRLDFPTYWDNDAVIKYGEGGMLASFYSKKNIGERDIGKIFDIKLYGANESVPDAGNFKKLGKVRINGQNRAVAAIFATDWKTSANIENFARMKRDGEIAVQTAKIDGIEESIMLNGKTIATMPVPRAWKDKYVIKPITAGDGLYAGIKFYEKNNYESSSSFEGRVFSLHLINRKASVSLQEYKVADLTINGGAYTLVVNRVSDVQTSQEFLNEFTELFANGEIPINDIWFGEDVIVVQRYEVGKLTWEE